MTVPLHKPAIEHFTYADYCAWPDEERCELIHGVAYDMSPAPLPRHQEVLLGFAGQMRESLKGKPCRVYVAPFDVRLPDGNENDAKVRTVVQPDVSVICDPEKRDSKGCRGAPDFIIEILSLHTAFKDQTVKRSLYEEYGVKEYWIVDAAHGTVTVYRLREDGRYGMPEIHEATGSLEVRSVPGLSVDLDDAFAE